MFQKTLGINDFYFGMPGFEFPMGNIQMVGKSDAEMFKGEKPLQTKLAPMFSLTDVATHAVDFWLSTEDLPAPDNRVTLDRDGNDQADLHAEQRGAEAAALRPAQVDAQPPRHAPDHLVPRTGYMKNEIPIGGCAHQAGTVRFGADPETSVLDANCKAHELDNLYVVDTSFFPSIGAVNPALDGDGQRAAGRRPPARAAGPVLRRAGRRRIARQTARWSGPWPLEPSSARSTAPGWRRASPSWRSPRPARSSPARSTTT